MVSRATTSQVHDLEARLSTVRGEIDRIRARHGIERNVTIVGVTKTLPTARVREALRAGLADIAENRIDELERKAAEMADAPVRWHYVGRLQRRQTRRVLHHSSLIQSVHSYRIAEAISRRAVDEGMQANILVQINTAGEDRKAGIEGDAILEDVHRICELPEIRVRGLMTMAPHTEDSRVIRETFRRARLLFEQAGKLSGFEAEHLSMGMTNDYLIAVEEGSTMLRLGTVLFGPRRND